MFAVFSFDFQHECSLLKSGVSFSINGKSSFERRNYFWQCLNPVFKLFHRIYICDCGILFFFGISEIKCEDTEYTQRKRDDEKCAVIMVFSLKRTNER